MPYALDMAIDLAYIAADMISAIADSAILLKIYYYLAFSIRYLEDC